MTVRGVSNNPASPLYNANAPGLTGQTGSLAAVWDAVLVNGFTGFTNLGWTIAFTAAGKRNYTMAAGGTGFQIFLDDTGPGAGTFKEARVSGFKTSSALGVGTGQWPNTTQMTAPSGALVVRKSATADGTARFWTMIGDGHTFYFFAETGDYTAPVKANGIHFGDFFTYCSSDVNNCALVGRGGENSGVYTTAGLSASLWGSQTQTSIKEVFDQLCGYSTTFQNDVLWGHYAAASFTNVGGSVQFGKDSNIAAMGYNTAAGVTPQMGCVVGGPGGNGTIWPNAFNYPNAADLGLYIDPVYIHHNGARRGYFKGMWNPLQHVPLAHNDTFSGTGNLAGKSFICQWIPGQLNTNSGGETTACVLIEYSDTWN